MAKRTTKKGPGRPPRQFTATQIRKIDEMARAQCRDYTIAEALGIEGEVFKRHFAERCRQKRAQGKTAVLQAQFAAATAEKGTPTDRIWWGKQYLEQSDKQKLDAETEMALNVRIINYADVKVEGFDDDGQPIKGER